MKNKNYHEKKTADCQIVISLFLKPLMQLLIDVTSFSSSKRFIFDPFFSNALII